MLASSCSEISSFPFLNQSSINDENPFLDDGLILSHVWYSQQQQLDLPTFTPEVEIECCYNYTSNEKAKEVEPQNKICVVGSSNRKRSAKDRHSKIHTSKGLRDRRMRLSLEIARRFFDLQDMLGFDKASKTVEWLFAKSRSAIKELKEKYLAEVSKCNYGEATVLKSCAVFDEIPREKKRRKLRIVDKESRYKARARARERTREKLIHRLEKSKQDSEENPVQASDEDEEPGEVLAMNGESATRLILNHCENQVLQRVTCPDRVHFPGSAIDMDSISLEKMKLHPAAAGLEVLEIDELDHVLMF